MSKATHNGTCQVCGRSHAANAKTRRLADHGYTVEWGFYNGICRGAGALPLELDTTLNGQTVAALLAFAVEMENVASGKTEVTHVAVEKRVTDARGRRVTERNAVDRETFEATQPSYRRWADAVKTHRMACGRRAENARAQAADLETLRDRVHGQPLTPRETEAPLRRETAPSYKAAYARCEELKAAGKRDVRQRRNAGYAPGFAITYRD